ncbi:acyl-CoA thioesterase [Streptosporangiaceae bacterium NEAU-GS5]|nr:acyl-CoA thioesterase [Streptosporangiaceae bacterium NEAU-GS5]
MSIVQLVDVHFDDLDAMGMLHNSRYALLFERAVTAYWTPLGWSPDIAKSRFDDVFLAVKEFSITYQAPVTEPGPVAVEFWIEKLGTSSAVYGFRVLSADRSVLHAEGRRVNVKLDPRTLRPAPISQELRDAAAPLMAAGSLALRV